MTATTEPSRVTAGDTIAWTKSLTDYPASAGWVLSYSLRSLLGSIDFSASASGDDHVVSQSAATSAVWKAGTYAWQSYVTKGAERHTVGSGQIIIDANFAISVGHDGRSEARQILDNLMTAYKTASSDKAFVQEYEIAGRHLRFNAKADWLAEINFWKAEVSREENAARRKAGKGLGTRIYERF